MTSGGGKLVAIYRCKLILLMILALMLLIVPVYTVAEEPATYGTNTYGTTVPSSLQRMLDAWGKGSFCASCHNMPYPLPPEEPLNKPALIPIGAIEIESGLKRLTYDAGRDVGAFYSPSGDRIVWVTDRLGNWTIWSMNPDGSGKKQLTSDDVISGWPSWSPDGKELTYWSWDVMTDTGDIWKMNTDGSGKVKLTTDGSFKGPPMWSPRGDRIAYTSELGGNLEVYVMNADGSGNRQITTGHSPKYSVETRVTWHPDGERLYYQALTFPIPERTYTIIPKDVAFVEIFMVNVDTGEEANLTPKLHENVRSVSPDGEKLACISLRSKNYGLWVMNADGSSQTRLTWHGFGDRAPCFDPDGKKIVYWSLAHGQQPDIWVINTDGSDETKLTLSPYQDIYPSWSPDGKKIIFESDRSGSFDIWQLSLDELIDVEIDFERCASPGCEIQTFLNIKLRDPKNTVRIENVAMRPDWGKEDDCFNYSDSLPKTISGSDGICKMKLDVEIPEDSKLGYHFYDLKIEYTKVGEEVSDKQRCYECSGGDLEIAISDRAECERLQIELDQELSQIYEREINKSITQGEVSAEMVEPLKGYLDFLVRPEGKYFLKANDQYYKAEYLRRAGRYSEALNDYQNVGTILFEGSKPEATQNTTIVILSAVIPLVIVITAAYLIFYKKKR
jgi:Tol biopolymer transport system component